MEVIDHLQLLYYVCSWSYLCIFYYPPNKLKVNG
jgi:hypothetical protein